MKPVFFLFLPVLLFNAGNAQTSSVLMQRCLGDSLNTILYCVSKTSDGGSISGGWVTANNGDVSGYKGGSKDGWIVKLNSLGGIEWQRCFGGSRTDIVYDIIEAADGGYVISGSSDSYDGDITSTHSVAGNAADDAFLAKLSASGQVEWVRCYGGSHGEIFKKILFTPDGGFICAGSAESDDGDVSGHHPASPLQDFNPATDVWVVKISSAGIIDWQKCIGGGFLDQADDMVATADGNYVLAGSGIGYQTTDMDTYYGGGDVWLIKISAAGNVIWAKAYGGSQDEHNATIVPASEGGYVVAFLTYSNDGICSSNNSGGAGITDIGIIKIGDDGSLAWSKCYGGSAYEWFGNLGYNDDRRGGLVATPDGGYILCGSTESVDKQVTGLHGPIWEAATGDNYDRILLGNDDIWVVKLNQSGDVQWQKCLGGSYIDWGQGIAPGASPNEFYVAGYVISNDGDISGNKVSLQGNGTEGWIASIKAGNFIVGSVFRDDNSNGVQDGGEPLVSGAMVTSANSNWSFASPTVNGSFINVTDTGQFVTTANYSPYYTVVPASITTPYHSSYYSSDTIRFALQPIPGNTDLDVTAFSTSFVRMGRTMQYKVMVRNNGTVNISSGVLKFVKDAKLIYQSSMPDAGTVTADTISWNFTNLNAGDILSFLVNLTVQTPPAANLGDTLTGVFSVLPVANDLRPHNDTAITKDLITGAFDPNDKTEVHGGAIPSSFAQSGDYLQYSIRFQNTGNDTAFKVVVRDTLDAKLDWSTVQMIASSHPVSFSVVNGNQLAWTFDDINLPDSNINEPLSHGYVVYEVKPKNNIALNDIIHNDASIYFDYNLPVETNDAATIVQNSFTVLPTKLLGFSGNRRDDLVTLSWKISGPELVDHFEIERSSDGRNFSLAGKKASSNQGAYQFADNIPGLQAGMVYYRLKVVEKDGSFYYSSILVFRLGSSKTQLNIYPNPAREQALLSYQSEKDGTIVIQLIDVPGNILAARTERIFKGQTVIELNEFNRLPEGKYLVKVEGNGVLQSRWVLKIHN